MMPQLFIERKDIIFQCSSLKSKVAVMQLALVGLGSTGEEVLNGCHKGVKTVNVVFIRNYEIAQKEHLKLAAIEGGSFPCLALELDPRIVTLHGFVTFKGHALQSSIAVITRLSETRHNEGDDAATVSFLRRIRKGVLQLVQEWKSHRYQLPAINNPQFTPNRFENQRRCSDF